MVWSNHVAPVGKVPHSFSSLCANLAYSEVVNLKAVRKPDMVFICHANPEDNDFALWLALQLANEGYPIWCDLTKLLGGEKFWEDIQNAISNRTIKFLFALSRHSNQKSGTLDELNCALAVEKKLGLKDFVITLKLDDLPYDDVYINVQRRNHIDLSSTWATGVAQLLKKLADEQVPKNTQFNPDAVCSWWRSQNEFSAEQSLIQQPDQHLSNWFPIEGYRNKSTATSSAGTKSEK